MRYILCPSSCYRISFPVVLFYKVSMQVDARDDKGGKRTYVKILEQTASSIPLPVHSVRQMSGLLQEDGRGRIDRRWRKGKDIYRDFLQN